MNHFKPGFFIQIPNEVLAYTVLGHSKDPSIRVTPFTLGVYSYLLYYKNNDKKNPFHGKAWVSTERLAVELAVSRNTITKHINILKNVGLITIGKYQRNNVYSFRKPKTPEQLEKEYPEEFKEYRRKVEEIAEKYKENEGNEH